MALATKLVSRIKNQARGFFCVRAPFPSLYLVGFFRCTLYIFLLLTLSVLVQI